MAASVTPEELNSLLALAKNWIDAQIPHASGGRVPSWITADHISALRNLQAPRKPEAVEPKDPDRGENWVGALLEYYQKNPSELRPTFTESCVTNGLNQLRFRCSVVISEHQHRPFPREEDYPGMDEAPTFARKKDAKQWAAKCALEWLRSRNHNKHELSPTTEKQAKVQKIDQPAAAHDTNMEPIVTTPRTQSPRVIAGPALSPSPTTRRSRNDTPMQRQSRVNGDSWWAQSPGASSSSPISPTRKNHSSHGKAISPTLDLSDLDLDATRLVDAMCKKLGLTPPRYVISDSKGDDARALLFDGYADWPSEPKMPPRVGEVSGIYTRKGCKGSIAEKVLEHLKEIEVERGREASLVLGGTRE